ncbi:MAG: TetR family transcriptional regulator [Acidimicrobiales bacterium]
MPSEVKGRVAGRDRRARRAAETRRRILEAAGSLFETRGYTATTIEAIAAAADVAVETVYSRFGNKRQLLSDYLDVNMAGDFEPIPLLDRPNVQAVADETDQRRQIEFIAAHARAICERAETALTVLRGAASGDHSLEGLLELNVSQRRLAQRTLLGMVARNGPLRPDVSFDDLVDTFSATVNPDSFHFLTKRCGWSADKFEAWVVDLLTLVVLGAVRPATGSTR